MRLRGPGQWVYKYPIHFCIFNRDCRRYESPRRIYFHFLETEDGSSFYLSFDKDDK